MKTFIKKRSKKEEERDAAKKAQKVKK